MDNQIDIVENNIDQVWENLTICKLPLHLALFMELSFFTHYLNNQDNRIKYRQIITNSRQGLQLLIRNLYKNCSKYSVRKRDIEELRKTNTPYDFADNALNFSARYNHVAYSLTEYRQGWLECKVKGRIVRFYGRTDQDTSQSLMHHALTRSHEIDYIDRSSLERIREQTPPERTLNLLATAIEHKTPEQYLDAIPEEVIHTFSELVLASSPHPSLNLETKFNGFTLGDYHKFWVNFSALMLAYLEACKIKYQSNSQRLKNSRVLIVEPNKLALLLSRIIREIPADSILEMLGTLILDSTSNRPDIQVQSLVPTGFNNLLFLSPSLVYTSSWEVCLLRYLAKISPGKYGAVIASQKERLSDELAKLFNQTGIRMAVRRKIVDSNNKTLTDIDLAILDEKNGYLSFIEVKWLIEPDSFQEESNAQMEIHKGIAQLREIEKMVALDKNQFILNVFNNQQISITNVTEIHYMLISEGCIEARIDFGGIDILDYQVSYGILEKNGRLSIKDRFNEVIKYHNNIKTNTKNEMVYNSIKLAGYLFQTPGLSQKEPPLEKKIHPNEPCLCGSGKKYKNCCQILQDSDENDRLDSEI
jgi:uncharacterized membrane protein YcaP (DUF421 family)